MHPRPIWYSLPLIRWVFPFITGILLFHEFNIPLAGSLVGLAVTLICRIIFSRSALWIQFKYFRISGMLVQASVVFVGMAVAGFHSFKNHPAWYGKHFQSGDDLLICLKDEPVVKSRYLRAEAEVLSVKHAEKTVPASGKIYIYFPVDSSAPALKYGSRIWLLRPNIQLIKGPDLPGGFDFRAYAATKNIFHQCYLKKRAWRIYDENGGNLLDDLLLSLRKYVVTKQNTFIGENSREAAVANALLIGYKDNLDKELLQAYAETGVVHVIAISGMHLALVNLMLIKLLSLIKLSRHRILSACINLTALWGFALLTGASASVLRSAWMFSFVSIGQLFKKEASVMNALSVSVFLLLAFDPFLILDAGFLLSHLAVLGLLVLQKPIFQMIDCRHKWLRKIWEMLSVTLAAQIFTLPLSLFYFHQFPNYFLLANLLIIPLSTVILLGCILLVLLAESFTLASFVGDILQRLIKGMNDLVECFSRLPGASCKGLDISLLQMIFLYLCIIFFCCWWYGYGKKYFLFSWSTLLIFFLLFFGRDFLVWKQQKIILFHQKGKTALALLQGDQLQISAEGIIDTTKNSSWTNLTDYFHVKKCDVYSMATANSMSWKSWVIYKLDSLHYPQPINEKNNCCAVWLSHNSRMKINTIKELYKPDCIVMDGTNKMWKIVQWQKECDSLLLRYHSISQDGPWVQDAE